MLNRYRNPRSKRKLKAKAKKQVDALFLVDLSDKVMSEPDKVLQMELRAEPRIRVESTSFKKEKPLKEGNTAGGKQKLQRSSKPLI